MMFKKYHKKFNYKIKKGADVMYTFTEPEINLMEICLLAEGLRKRGVNFTVRSYFYGAQILVENGNWDAICHGGSYGYEKGLLEVSGLPQCEGDVIGWLTAEKVLRLVDGEEYSFD